MISICRDHASNVKRWRDGQMALRWCAAGMVEAGKQFRRVNGHLHLPALRARARTRVHRTCRHHAVRMRTSTQPDDHRAATEVPRNSGHPPIGAATFMQFFLSGVIVPSTGTGGDNDVNWNCTQEHVGRGGDTD